MVLQNYQNLIEMTSNIIYIVAFGVGFKCPRKIHLNTQCLPSIFVASYSTSGKKEKKSENDQLCDFVFL